MMKERIKFIDAARALGILAIYAGHVQLSEGGSCIPFVWCFHVQLFFFMSGCTEVIAKKRNIPSYILSKVQTLLIPWLVACLLSIGVLVLLTRPPVSEILIWLKAVAQGCIRNRFLNGSLWFFTCLFVAQIFFRVLQILKNKCLILLAALALNIYISNFSGISIPSQPYNVDSALVYMFYYAAGYICFPYLKRLLQAETGFGRFFMVIGCMTTIGYTVLYYRGNNLLAPFYAVRYAKYFVDIFSALIIILSVIFVSKMVENNALIRKIGQNTLYLCIAEYFVTTLLDLICWRYNIELIINNSLSGLLYACMKLLLALYLFVPLIKKILNICSASIGYLIHGFTNNTINRSVQK